MVYGISNSVGPVGSVNNSDVGVGISPGEGLFAGKTTKAVPAGENSASKTSEKGFFANIVAFFRSLLSREKKPASDAEVKAMNQRAIAQLQQKNLGNSEAARTTPRESGKNASGKKSEVAPKVAPKGPAISQKPSAPTQENKKTGSGKSATGSSLVSDGSSVKQPAGKTVEQSKQPNQNHSKPESYQESSAKAKSKPVDNASGKKSDVVSKAVPKKSAIPQQLSASAQKNKKTGQGNSFAANLPVSGGSSVKKPAGEIAGQLKKPDQNDSKPVNRLKSSVEAENKFIGQGPETSEKKLDVKPKALVKTSAGMDKQDAALMAALEGGDYIGFARTLKDCKPAEPTLRAFCDEAKNLAASSGDNLLLTGLKTLFDLNEKEGWNVCGVKSKNKVARLKAELLALKFPAPKIMNSRSD
ncbi:hypothetical protein [Paraburkholderia bonniea]|uniref:hypothetical protein n=1 Tax=Paraburkholderia bonniea TaxID=2152891 RepID=UPI001292AF41|nr:hypothetical protein [Paraburkholderia bonniea]